ncbi:hypothetical protein [Streptomyces sp. NPDC001020]
MTAIHGAVAAGTEVSRTRDSGPDAAAALDYSLSQRALIAVNRTDTVAELITRRLATLAHSGLQTLDTATVRAVVRQAVRDVHTAPPPPPADLPADPTVAAARAIVDDLAAINHKIGELMLEVAPAYLSDTEAADVLALLCEQIGATPTADSLPAATPCQATAAPCTAPSCEPRVWSCMVKCSICMLHEAREAPERSTHDEGRRANI